MRGRLNLPASPQGSPVIFQAGASPVGREFAARHAEVIFTRHTRLSDGQETYADLKRRVAAEGATLRDRLGLPRPADRRRAA
ncbi:LLM class flavin-dependent oxidoreductase [Streptomyces sp. NPDC051173]|uniref:LLM class flavin-dependent oxidoreductase n=1 Tax=Streptomyces sp. NPDC051173 TaxID=3155164 RepID=UPI00344B1834